MKKIFKSLGFHTLLCVLSFVSVGVIYAAWNDDVISGSALTADSWNNLVTQVEGITAGSGKFISGTNTGDAVFTGGNVGIGVSNPSRELDVEGSSRFGSNVYIGENTVQAYVNARVISEDTSLKLGASRSSNGNGVYVGSETDTPVNFLQNNTTAMYISEDQDIGIGTNEPNAFGSGATTLSLSDPLVGTANLEFAAKNIDGATIPFGRIAFTHNDGTNTTSRAWITSMSDPSLTGEGNLLFMTADKDDGVLYDRMIIDYDGNVGIGRTDPEFILDTDSAKGPIRVQQFGHAGTATTLGIPTHEELGILTYYINDENFAGIGSTSGGQIQYTGRGHIFRPNSDTTSATDDVSFFMNSSGRMGIGTRTPNAKLDVKGEGMFGNFPYYNGSAYNTVNGAAIGSNFNWFAGDNINSVMFVQRIPSSPTGSLVRYYSGSSLVGDVSTDGTSTSYGTTSDRRLKENFKPLNNALNTVNEIEVSNYNFIGSDTKMDGFIAQQLDDILPYAVKGTEDNIDEDGNILPMTVDYSKVVPILTAAIQELSEQNNDLIERIEQLESH